MIVEVNALCFAFCVDKCINAQAQSEDLKSLSLSNFIQYKLLCICTERLTVSL